MSGNQPIKNYTAADIEKYHNGLLTPAEMHAMEKAALDDPLLADAMEGYAIPGAQPDAAITELTIRLQKRIRQEDETKIIPLSGRSYFPWLRAAMVTGILAGAATMAYFLMFRKESAEIAQQPVTQPADRQQQTTIQANPSAIPKADSNAVTIRLKRDITEASNRQQKAADTITNRNDLQQTVSAAPAGITNNLKESTAAENDDRKAEILQSNADVVSTPAPAPFTAAKKKAEMAGLLNRAEKTMAKTTIADSPYRNPGIKIFRGRVTDAANLGVPFAKVTNPLENVGTYTDARGFFNLTYPDTVLHVQVRSIGFENNNFTLRYQSPDNQVILRDDRQLNAFVVSNQKPNNAQMRQRSFTNNIQLTEPEPADGWENYDTYLANNIEIPEEYRSRPNATAAAVELSFEVDKNGQPIDIRVEKSLCDKCDKEAIRLIKEGPKWKQKALHGRTTVSIPFSRLF